MDLLGQFHPQIVHTPVALLVFSAFFAILGRLFDREWVRKASVLLLVFGFLGAFAAVRSGLIAHRVPERQQGVSEAEIDEHAEFGQYTLYLAGGALVAVAAAARMSGGAAAAVAGLALLLQIAAAVMVGVTGYAGGELVYEQGANVKIGGVLVKNPGASEHHSGGGDALADSAAATGQPTDRDDDEKK